MLCDSGLYSLQAIGGGSPRTAVDSMADIIWALNQHQFDATVGWMDSAVRRAGFPNERVTQASKEVFARKTLKLVLPLRVKYTAVQKYGIFLH